MSMISSESRNVALKIIFMIFMDKAVLFEETNSNV